MDSKRPQNGVVEVLWYLVRVIQKFSIVSSAAGSRSNAILRCVDGFAVIKDNRDSPVSTAEVSQFVSHIPQPLRRH